MTSCAVFGANAPNGYSVRYLIRSFLETRRYIILLMTEQTHKALSRALYKVLIPMVRLLLRHGVSYKSFADISRRVFVDVAEQDFALPGRKPSNSRTAVLTGINRKDIAKLKDRPHPLSENGQESPNPAARVIVAWINDDRFQGADGQPHVLQVEQGDDIHSFTDLVRDYSSDVPVRALLDELIRLQAIEKVDSDKVRLLVSAYIPIADMKENLRIFGTAASDLLNTMDHNITAEEPGPFIQRTVSYNNISEEDLEIIRARCREEGQAFLLRVNEWLSHYEQTPNSLGTENKPFRAGLGVYYVESGDAAAAKKKFK